MSMKLKFDRFLQRFNNRLTSEESPYIKREDLKSYLQQHAKLVNGIVGHRREWSANLIEPGRVYLHWIKDSEIWDDENVRIQVATLNPGFGKARPVPPLQANMHYLESSSDTRLGWYRKTFPESSDLEVMPVTYRSSRDGEIYWNGWESPSLEVWEFPPWALNLNIPSLNYPEGDLL